MLKVTNILKFLKYVKLKRDNDLAFLANMFFCFVLFSLLYADIFSYIDTNGFILCLAGLSILSSILFMFEFLLTTSIVMFARGNLLLCGLSLLLGMTPVILLVLTNFLLLSFVLFMLFIAVVLFRLHIGLLDAIKVTYTS